MVYEGGNINCETPSVLKWRQSFDVDKTMFPIEIWKKISLVFL